MPRLIALLRGVNVGGNLLKMERLRALCAELGFGGVATYIQSGNVVFDAGGSVGEVARAIEKKLVGEARLPVAVVVRSAGEWAAAVAGNPFLNVRGIDRSRLYVTFLAAVPAKAGLKGLAAFDTGPDQLHVRGREIYLHCPGGYGRTRLSNNVLEKLLGVKATTRNWNTVLKLQTMASS